MSGGHLMIMVTPGTGRDHTGSKDCAVDHAALLLFYLYRIWITYYTIPCAVIAASEVSADLLGF